MPVTLYKGGVIVIFNNVGDILTFKAEELFNSKNLAIVSEAINAQKPCLQMKLNSLEKQIL